MAEQPGRPRWKCSACKGRGYVGIRYCEECEGSGGGDIHRRPRDRWVRTAVTAQLSVVENLSWNSGHEAGDEMVIMPLADAIGYAQSVVANHRTASGPCNCGCEELLSRLRSRR